MIKLGMTGKDKITGFTGVVMARAEYLSGCAQILLTPQRLDKDGKRLDGEWFDEQRVEVDREKQQIRLNNVIDDQDAPGADREAPKR